MPETLVYGFQNGSVLFSSPHKVYVAHEALSSIYIISSTIYEYKKLFSFERHAYLMQETDNPSKIKIF
jgi:hypothetical protein